MDTLVIVLQYLLIWAVIFWPLTLTLLIVGFFWLVLPNPPPPKPTQHQKLDALLKAVEELKKEIRQ